MIEIEQSKTAGIDDMPNSVGEVPSNPIMPEGPAFRFATFEFDARTCELFQDGRRVTLERQPAIALRRLLQSAGETVTRQELIAAIWDGETSVSFDDGLNYCIRQLRVALADDARVPKFIATAPRRGYRFVADVQTVAARTPVRRPRSREVFWIAAAVLLFSVAVIESTPNNHHELAGRAVRAIHDALY